MAKQSLLWSHGQQIGLQLGKYLPKRTKTLKGGSRFFPPISSAEVHSRPHATTCSSVSVFLDSNEVNKFWQITSLIAEDLGSQGSNHSIISQQQLNCFLPKKPSKSMLHTLGSSVESFWAWVKLGTFSLTLGRRLVLHLWFFGRPSGLGLCLGLRTRCLRSKWPAQHEATKIWGLVMRDS